MLILTAVFASLAALLHVYIFWMESIAWTSAKTRKTFGTSAEAAEQTKELAFNQGFYNLFLAIAAGIGVVLLATGELVVSRTLILAGTGMMLAASLVLLISSPSKARAAITQGVFPLAAAVCCVISLI